MKRETVWENRKVVNRKGAVVMKEKTDRESQEEWNRGEKGEKEKSKEEWSWEEMGQEGKHQEE